MAPVTICSDFGDQKKKICHCFHFPPFYLPWSDETRCHDHIFLESQRTLQHLNSYQPLKSNHITWVVNDYFKRWSCAQSFLERKIKEENTCHSDFRKKLSGEASFWLYTHRVDIPLEQTDLKLLASRLTWRSSPGGSRVPSSKLYKREEGNMRSGKEV